jgi:membrane associated rhomboid family serine protease
MNRLGSNIPTAWLLIIPFVNIWWLWEYAEGVERVTNKAMSQVVAFILLLLLSAIGDAVIQDAFNKVNLVSEVAPA